MLKEHHPFSKSHYPSKPFPTSHPKDMVRLIYVLIPGAFPVGAGYAGFRVCFNPADSSLREAPFYP